MAEAAAPPPNSVLSPLATLYRFLSPRRKLHLAVSLALMVSGAMAELLTIGAVLPFLALLASPDNAERFPQFLSVLSALGLARDGSFVLGAALLLILAAIGAAILRLVLSWVSQDFVLKLGHEIGAEMFSRALRQPYGYYLGRNSSELLSGVEKVYTVIFGILLPLMQGVAAAIIALCVALLLFAISPMIATIAALSVASIYFLVSAASRARLARGSAEMAEASRLRYKTIQEGLGGIRDILLNQSQEVFDNEFRRQGEQYRRAQAASLFISGAPRHILEAAGIVSIAILAVIVSGRPSGLIGAIPVLGALALGAQRLLPLLQQAYSGWSQLAGNRDALADILALLAAPVVATPARDRSRPPAPFQREIRFDRVSFAYDGVEPVLRDVDLAIPRGARLGIVGRTGSGKSTLLDLLVGLLEPTSGEIRVDGKRIDDESRGEWQAQIAHVPQSIFLTDASIAANIAFGEAEADIDMERVRSAALAAAASGFIEQMPAGYGTRVGERGVRLSTGQRQRIGIARALYARATLLIFDEATSALDSETEADVLRAVAALGPRMTIVTIAHRASTLSGCDRILRIESGTLVEEGS